VERKTVCEIVDYTVKLRLAHPGRTAAGVAHKKKAPPADAGSASVVAREAGAQTIGWLIAMIQ
jgi:hypothetical protein